MPIRSNSGKLANLKRHGRGRQVQVLGHTAPKTKAALKRAMGGVFFIDEAHHLYRPENERDRGQESIEILLQLMEDNRDDRVVIPAGDAEPMKVFFSRNPAGRPSRPQY